MLNTMKYKIWVSHIEAVTAPIFILNYSQHPIEIF